jgi:hypothetical protein
MPSYYSYKHYFSPTAHVPHALMSIGLRHLIATTISPAKSTLSVSVHVIITACLAYSLPVFLPIGTPPSRVPWQCGAFSRESP